MIASVESRGRGAGVLRRVEFGVGVDGAVVKAGEEGDADVACTSGRMELSSLTLLKCNETGDGSVVVSLLGIVTLGC